jgi:hypothetical protein
MLLSGEERSLLEAACANRDNEAAQTLMNLFGVATADEIIEHVAATRAPMRTDLINEVRKAIEAQRRFRPRQ